VIAVFVVDGQKMPGLFIELSSALGADQTMDLEGAFSIITPGWIRFLQFLKSLLNGLIVSCLLRGSLRVNSIGSIFHLKHLRSHERI